MPWYCRDPDILPEDLEILAFESAESRTFTIERRDDENDIIEDSKMIADDEWSTWLKQHPFSNKPDDSSRINLILGGRAERPWGHDPSIVSKFPWSQDVFLQIKQRFLVHSEILRTINRNTSCMFSSMKFTWNIEKSLHRSIVYNCRSAASWPGDMALSVTFLTDSLTTNAVLFGCDFKTPDFYDEDVTIPDIIRDQIKSSDLNVLHPMLLMTIFADMERDRQIEFVRKKLQTLGQRVRNLTTRPPESESLPTAQGLRGANTGNTIGNDLGLPRQSPTSNQLNERRVTKKADVPTALLWLEVSRLRIGLENWQCQLKKMIAHVEELNLTEFAPQHLSGKQTCHSDQKLHQLREAGIRIKDRLQELVDEYSEYIRECTHTMDGMSLATQLEMNKINRNDARTNLKMSKVNLGVAKMTRDDSSLMKSIAVLGMLFLPATFVTTFFSMGFFDWGGNGVKAGTSKYIWIYALTAVMLTLATVGIFYYYVLRRRTAHKDDDEEFALQDL